METLTSPDPLFRLKVRLSSGNAESLVFKRSDTVETAVRRFATTSSLSDSAAARVRKAVIERLTLMDSSREDGKGKKSKKRGEGKVVDWSGRSLGMEDLKHLVKHLRGAPVVFNLGENRLSGLPKSLLLSPTLRSLRSLDLRSNALLSIPSLEAMVSLRSLDVSDNLLTSLRGVEVLPFLSELCCGHNELVSFDGVDRCKNLRTLLAEDNDIRAIAVLQRLRGLRRLRHLDISNNPVVRGLTKRGRVLHEEKKKDGGGEGRDFALIAMKSVLPWVKVLTGKSSASGEGGEDEGDGDGDLEEEKVGEGEGRGGGEDVLDVDGVADALSGGGEGGRSVEEGRKGMHKTKRSSAESDEEGSGEGVEGGGVGWKKKVERRSARRPVSAEVASAHPALKRFTDQKSLPRSKPPSSPPSSSPKITHSSPHKRRSSPSKHSSSPKPTPVVASTPRRKAPRPTPPSPPPSDLFLRVLARTREEEDDGERREGRRTAPVRPLQQDWKSTERHPRDREEYAKRIERKVAKSRKERKSPMRVAASTFTDRVRAQQEKEASFDVLAFLKTISTPEKLHEVAGRGGSDRRVEVGEHSSPTIPYTPPHHHPLPSEHDTHHGSMDALEAVQALIARKKRTIERIKATKGM